jgi:hypothetical protein
VGRPHRAIDPLTRFAHVRLTEAQAETLRRLASARGCSEAEVIRHLLRDEAQRMACEGGKEAAGRAWCDCARCRAIHEGRGSWAVGP